MWEVDVRLLRLDATEGGDLRHLGGDRQDGVGAIAKRVVEHTAMGEGQVSRGVDRKAGTGRGRALKRGHGARLERLTQFGDAVHCVGAFASPIDAA